VKSIEILPIRPAFLQRARKVGLDDQGQPVRRLQAAGGEPCRDVLRPARSGEGLILASYCPFDHHGPYREYGPIFIRADSAIEPVDRHRLPLGSSEGEGYLAPSFALRAYNRNQDIVQARLVSAESALPIIHAWLGRTEVEHVDARFAAFGCFACRIIRA